MVVSQTRRPRKRSPAVAAAISACSRVDGQCPTKAARCGSRGDGSFCRGCAGDATVRRCGDVSSSPFYAREGVFRRHLYPGGLPRISGGYLLSDSLSSFKENSSMEELRGLVTAGEKSTPGAERTCEAASSGAGPQRS